LFTSKCSGFLLHFLDLNGRNNSTTAPTPAPIAVPFRYGGP
jgi:hypothetical protein